jgi:recombination DNA repair RAD52 pathway protein
MDIQMYQNNGEGFTVEQLEQLDAPLDATLIKVRPDGKKYLKGSTEFDNANRIFGYGKWGYKTISRTLQKVYDLDDKVVGLYFYVEVELYVAGAMFPFHGDGGQGIVLYNPQGYENASKGATTDAVKRALRHYGDQFGLCLYDEDSLVDVGDGVLTTVKQYNPKQQQGNQKRIVESQNTSKQLPSPQQQVAPTPIVKAPPVKALRKKCDEIFGEGQWDAVLAIVFGVVHPDDNFTPEMQTTLNNAMSSKANEKQLQSIQKLCQHLGKAEPENAAELNFVVARRILQALTAEYKESRQQKSA